MAAGNSGFLAAPSSQFGGPSRLITANSYLTGWPYWNVVNAQSALTVTLPAPAPGAVVLLRVANASTSLVTLQPSQSALIQPGANSSRILWAGESAVLVSDGTDWLKVSGLSIPMQCSMHNASTQAFSSGTNTLVNIDTVDNDNTGLMADTLNKRILFKRSGLYVVGHATCYDPGNNAGGTWQANSGCASNVLNNAAAGGAVFGSAKGTLVSGAGSTCTPAGCLVVSATAGHYVALAGFAGATAGQFLSVSPDLSILQVTEVPSW